MTHITTIRGATPTSPAVLTYANPEPWTNQAACDGHDPELWFPDDSDTRTAAAALLICGECPVRTSCADHALANGELGIWGGLTQGQRKSIIRKARRAA